MAEEPQSGTNDAPMAESQPTTTNNNLANASNNNDDDASQSTEITTVYRPIPYEGEEKEYTIKFVFRPEEDQNRNVAKLHYDTLYTISQVYPEVKIFDNRGSKLNRKKLEALKTYSAYLRHFDLHYSKGNESKKRKPMYIVIHRFQSKVSISEIRRHSAV